MSLELTLQSAISGMQTSKASLQTISNNIANVNTEGYTRKIIDQKSRVFDGKGYGVEIGAISRQVNQAVLKQLRGEMGSLENIIAKQDYLTQLNSFFGTPADNNSISHKIGDLGAHFNNLAISPEVSANHFLTVNSAEDTATCASNMVPGNDTLWCDVSFAPGGATKGRLAAASCNLSYRPATCK